MSICAITSIVWHVCVCLQYQPPQRLPLPTWTTATTNDCQQLWLSPHETHRNFYLFATFFLPFSSTLSTFFSLPGRNLCLSLAFLLSPLAFGFALEWVYQQEPQLELSYLGWFGDPSRCYGRDTHRFQQTARILPNGWHLDEPHLSLSPKNEQDIHENFRTYRQSWSSWCPTCQVWWCLSCGGSHDKQLLMENCHWARVSG